MSASSVADDRVRSPMGRICEGDTRWRVVVETWTEDGAYRGKFHFETDDLARRDARESAVLLRGETREDVLSCAYDLPEDRLRRVLYSLG